MAPLTDKQAERIDQLTPFQAPAARPWDDFLPRWLTTRPENHNLPAPLTLLIMAAVLGLAVLAPQIAASGQLALLVVGAIGGIVGLVMLERLPVLGFLALVPAALVVKYSLGTGSQTGINIAVLIIAGLVGLWVLDMFSRERRMALMRDAPIKIAFLFSLVALVSFGFGQFRWFPADPAPLRAQIGGLGIYLLSALTLLLAAHRIRSLRDLEWIVWVFLAFGGLYVIVRTVPFLKPYYQRIFVREAAQGALFYVWLASLGLGQVLLNTRLHIRWRAVIAAMLLGLLYMNFYVTRDWVSGWLPPLIAVWVVAMIAIPRLSILLSFAGALGLIAFSSIVTGVFSEGDNAYSTLTRLEAWRILWEIIKVNPVFGVGMANYYWYTPLYTILGYHVSFNSHNNYIDLLAQTGIVGLLVFFVWFAALWRSGWRLFGRVPGGFAKAYTAGALGGLAGTLAAGLLGDWILPFVYNIGLGGFRASLFAFFFLGGMLAVRRLIDQEKAEPAG